MLGAPAPRSRALVVWGAALAIYIVATAGRTSFGVAGVAAIDRFEITAGTLSLFTVIQMGMYAAAQIPVGILLDKVGSRLVLVAGALILAAGQIGLALATSVEAALAVRALIGLGDATAFTAVLRLIPYWFPIRQIPMVTQMTGILGQLGQVISSFPFAWALKEAGWTPAFSGLAVMGVLIAIIAMLLVRNRPSASDRPDASTADRPSMSLALRHPGSWLGFWAHFVTPAIGSAFLLLWGVPWMTVGHGIPEATAAGILVVSSAAGILVGPIIGELCARHPLRRSWLVLGTVAVTVLAYAAVLIVDRQIALWEFAVLLFVAALGSAASAVGFDFVRTSVPLDRLSTANGLVNMGGFISTLMVMGVIGLVLDYLAPDGNLTPNDFRIAMAAQFVVVIIGVIGVIVSRRATRKWMVANGTFVPPIRVVIARIRAERERELAAERVKKAQRRESRAGIKVARIRVNPLHRLAPKMPRPPLPHMADLSNLMRVPRLPKKWRCEPDAAASGLAQPDVMQADVIPLPEADPPAEPSR